MSGSSNTNLIVLNIFNQIFKMFASQVNNCVNNRCYNNSVKPILIVLSSKARPRKIEGFYKTWRQTTSGLSEVITCIDDDDETLDQYIRHKDILFNIGKGRYMCDSINRVFKKYPKYKYYFIVSDDHRIRTKKWEEMFIKKIEENGGKGVCYGNDLMYGEKLSTAAFVSGNIFRALGFIALPGLYHMWVDKSWMELGKQLNKLYYFSNIIIEHMHYKVGKSEADESYLRVNNKKIHDHDKNVFESWKKNKMKEDIQKIKDYLD